MIKGRNYHVIKIGLVGDSYIGKTALLRAFFYSEYNYDGLLTIGTEKFEGFMEMKNGENLKLIFRDTSFQERFINIVCKNLRKCNGAIICFDLTKRITFDRVTIWLKELRNIPDFSIALFGCKCDEVERREVRKEEAERFAKDNNLFYIETSAKLNINIKEGIEKIANEVYESLIKNVKEEDFDYYIKLKVKKQIYNSNKLNKLSKYINS